MSLTIAIDGPAGSGKGTITKILAEKLNLINIDTGAMYRCVALEALNQDLKLEDTEKIIEITKRIKIEFGNNEEVYLDGVDVTKAIREKRVTEIVSPISSIVEVRKELVKKQQEMAEGINVIMEGRDITTVVLPNATYKFYLDASLEERAQRRFNQNKEAGIEISLEDIKESIKKRDYNDMNKKVGALKRTDEQIYVDTTNLTIDEVVKTILENIKEQ